MSAVLSNKQITERLGDSVIISPFNPDNVNTSSYDVQLGEWYYIEHRPWWWQRRPVYNIWDREHVQRVWGEPKQARAAYSVLPRRAGHNHWRSFSGDDRIILIPPKHTILAHTEEFIGGRTALTTMMKARSSFGRNFIEVCKCAGYGDVGYINRWTMEITNNSRFYHIPLVVGRRIAQIVFLETGEVDGTYTKAGNYQSADDLQKLKREWKPELMLPRLDLDRDIPIHNRAMCPHNDYWDDCPVCRH